MPSAWNRATCRYCEEPIVWVVSKNGNKMPLNADPIKRFILIEDVAHNVSYPLISYDDGETRVVTLNLDEGHEMDPLALMVDTYRSHIDVCPARNSDAPEKLAREEKLRAES